MNKFNEHNGKNASKEKREKLSHGFEHTRYQKTGRNEQDDITDQIDDAVLEIKRIRVVNNDIEIIINGVKGLEIDVLQQHLLIGQSINPVLGTP